MSSNGQLDISFYEFVWSRDKATVEELLIWRKRLRVLGRYEAVKWCDMMIDQRLTIHRRTS